MVLRHPDYLAHSQGNNHSGHNKLKFGSDRQECAGTLPSLL